MSRRRAPTVLQTPIAVTSDGKILVNVALTDGPQDPKKLLERALAERGRVFIGVAVTPNETALVLKSVDDSTAEVIAWVWGDHKRRR